MEKYKITYSVPVQGTITEEVIIEAESEEDAEVYFFENYADLINKSEYITDDIYSIPDADPDIISIEEN